MGKHVTGHQKESGLVTKKASPKLQKPSLYQVVMLNDDYTPMDFVVLALEVFFSMSLENAIVIMLQVHQQGRAICGIYVRDIAETKVALVNSFASRNGHPLLCKMEKV